MIAPYLWNELPLGATGYLAVGALHVPLALRDRAGWRGVPPASPSATAGLLRGAKVTPIVVVNGNRAAGAQL